MESKGKVAFGASAGVATMVAAMLGGVFDREGGYSNHPADRGGETNHGVTAVVARKNGYTGPMKVFPKQCETEKNVCAEKIYYQTYIEEPGLIPIIKLSPAVADELFDTATNMGPARPGPWLQQSLNTVCQLTDRPALKADGKLGPQTLDYFATCQAKLTKVTFCIKILNALDEKQLNRYQEIVRKNPGQKVFYKGWVNHRIGQVNRKRCDLEQ